MNKVLAMKYNRKMLFAIYYVIFGSYWGLILFPNKVLAATPYEGLEFVSGYSNYHIHNDYIHVDLGANSDSDTDYCLFSRGDFHENKIVDDDYLAWIYSPQGTDLCGAEVLSQDVKVYNNSLRGCSVCAYQISSGDGNMYCYDFNSNRGHYMHIGSRTVNHCYSPLSSQLSNFYSTCSISPPPLEGYITKEGDSSFVYKLVCEGKKAKLLQIRFTSSMQTDALFAREDFLINGTPAKEIDVVYDYHDSCNTYYWYGDIEWDVPVSLKCGDTITITPTLLNNVYSYSKFESISAVLEDDKILKYVSGNGQKGNICETLKEPFVVSANDKDVGISWQVTKSPSGSNPNITQIVTTNTDTETVSSAYLKLGSLPGTYTAEAMCAECTEGSPQTFTATAQCPEVKKYYQDNYKDPYDTWCKYTDTSKNPSVTTSKACQYDAKGNPLEGYTAWTIEDKGCALTSIAMVMEQYGSDASPKEWNEFLTEIGGYTKDARVKWTVIDAITDGGITYIEKPEYYGYRKIKDKELKTKTVDKSLMDDYLKKCIPVIVQVYNQKTGNMHWVTATGKSGDDYTINDPSKSNDYKFLSLYGDIYNLRAYENKYGGCQ